MFIHSLEDRPLFPSSKDSFQWPLAHASLPTVFSEPERNILARLCSQTESDSLQKVQFYKQSDHLLAEHSLFSIKNSFFVKRPSEDFIRCLLKAGIEAFRLLEDLLLPIGKVSLSSFVPSDPKDGKISLKFANPLSNPDLILPIVSKRKEILQISNRKNDIKSTTNSKKSQKFLANNQRTLVENSRENSRKAVRSIALLCLFLGTKYSQNSLSFQSDLEFSNVLKEVFADFRSYYPSVSPLVQLILFSNFADSSISSSELYQNHPNIIKECLSTSDQPSFNFSELQTPQISNQSPTESFLKEIRVSSSTDSPKFSEEKSKSNFPGFYQKFDKLEEYFGKDDLSASLVSQSRDFHPTKANQAQFSVPQTSEKAPNKDQIQANFIQHQSISLPMVSAQLLPQPSYPPTNLLLDTSPANFSFQEFQQPQNFAPRKEREINLSKTATTRRENPTFAIPHASNQQTFFDRQQSEPIVFSTIFSPFKENNNLLGPVDAAQAPLPLKSSTKISDFPKISRMPLSSLVHREALSPTNHIIESGVTREMDRGFYLDKLRESCDAKVDLVLRGSYQVQKKKTYIERYINKY